MERKFLEQHMVSPALVEDCGRYVYKLSINPTLQPRDVIGLARNLAMNQRLFRCLVSAAFSLIARVVRLQVSDCFCPNFMAN